MIIMRVILIIEIENLRILYFVNVKSPQITNSRKSKHAKITRSTIYMVNLPSAEYTRVASAVCVCVCRIHKAVPLRLRIQAFVAAIMKLKARAGIIFRNCEKSNDPKDGNPQNR